MIFIIFKNMACMVVVSNLNQSSKFAMESLTNLPLGLTINSGAKGLQIAAWQWAARSQLHGNWTSPTESTTSEIATSPNHDWRNSQFLPWLLMFVCFLQNWCHDWKRVVHVKRWNAKLEVWQSTLGSSSAPKVSLLGMPLGLCFGTYYHFIKVLDGFAEKVQQVKVETYQNDSKWYFKAYQTATKTYRNQPTRNKKSYMTVFLGKKGFPFLKGPFLGAWPLIHSMHFHWYY